MSHTFKDRLQLTLKWRGQLSWQGVGKIDWLESRCERILLFLSLHRDNRPDERRLLCLATNTLMTLAWVLYGFFFFLFSPHYLEQFKRKWEIKSFCLLSLLLSQVTRWNLYVTQPWTMSPQPGLWPGPEGPHSGKLLSCLAAEFKWPCTQDNLSIGKIGHKDSCKTEYQKLSAEMEHWFGSFKPWGCILSGSKN